MGVKGNGMGTMGPRIRALREEAGLRQHQLAERAGVSPCHICRIEKDAYGPKSGLLVRIAAVLEVPPYELFISDDAMGTEQRLGARLRNALRSPVFVALASELAGAYLRAPRTFRDLAAVIGALCGDGAGRGRSTRPVRGRREAVSATEVGDDRAAARRRIAELRRKKGLMQQDLAKKLHMSPSQLSRIESGKSGLGTGVLFRIAGILGAPPHELLAAHDDARGSGRRLKAGLREALRSPVFVALASELSGVYLHDPRAFPNLARVVGILARKRGRSRA